MKSLATLSVIAAVISVGCATPPCDDVRTPDEALGSTCGIVPEESPTDTGCTPSRGTICTVVGTGEAGAGTENVRGTETRTYLPQDVTIAPDGRMFYLDWNNHTVRVLGNDNIVHTVAGTGELTDGVDPPIPPGTPRMPSPALRFRLNHPTNIAFDPQGRMLIAAWHNSMIKRVSDVGQPGSLIEDLCGTGARAFGGDNGPAIDASLDLPVGVALAANGDLYIADQANQRIRRVDNTGVITTVVGTGTAGYSGDGGPALMATLRNPIGQAASPAGRIDLDSQGNLYIADTGNNVVRRVGTDGMITTVAGTGTAGFTGDGGPAASAQLNQPTDVEIGPDGTLYIADTQNSCVRSVGADGVIRTVAGRCGQRGFEGDGAAPTQAKLDRPAGVETDTLGRLWIADTYNHRVRVVLLR